MSQTIFKKVIARALVDSKFREKFLLNPESIFSDYPKLSADDKKQLLSINSIKGSKSLEKTGK